MSTILYSQINSGNILKYDTAFFSTNKVDCLNNDIVLSENKDTVYCINNEQNTNNNEINLLGFSTISNSFFEVKVYFETEDDYLRNLKFIPVVDFWFKNDTLYMLLSKRIYKFSIYNNSYKLIAKYELDFKPTRAILLSNGKVLLYEENLRSDNAMHIFDCEKNKLEFNKKLSFPIPIFSLFRPRDIICVDNNYIYYSPANEYKINIYDYNFNIVDSIVFLKKNWKNFPVEMSEKTLYEKKMKIDIINSLDDDVRNKYSSIARLFIFEDKLIIMYFIKEKENRLYLYDVWQRKKDGWDIILDGINDYDTININTKDKLFPFSKFVFKNGYIYRFSSLTPIFRNDYKKEKDYIKAYENYQIENDCLLGVEKLKLIK